MAFFSPLFFGSAATGGAAATTGLIGTGGAFSFGTAAGTAAVGLAGASSIQQGRVASAQGKFAKDIAIRNQESLERQAHAERDAARIEEKRVSRRGKIVMAAQRAVIGKSGIGLAGATLSVLADTAAQFSLDRNLVLRRGLLRGRELRQRGRIGLAEGRFAKTLGTQTKRLSFVKAGASILGAVGTASLLKSRFGTPTQIGTTSPSIFRGSTFA